jgi:ABC-type branched-subunit amino acid transport system ATPase component
MTVVKSHNRIWWSVWQKKFEILGLTKNFGTLVALDHIEESVPEGSIFGLLGPNGAGKTTLFNILTGFYKPDSGEVWFGRENLTDLKPHQICQRGIGRTFQIAQVFHNMTVFENIMMGVLVRENDFTKARAIAEEIVRRMGFVTRANDYAVGLSLWETKILEISRALATHPTLLLVDEPMAGLTSLSTTPA